MPFKPEKTDSNSSSFLGVKPLTLVSAEQIEDERFDVFLKIEFMQQGSQYTDKMTIIGNFDRDIDGNISGTESVSKKIFRLFEALGDEGGIDRKGNFVEKDDTIIENIGEYLTDHYAGGTDSYPYLGYIYKKPAKNGKEYTEIYPALFKNDKEGMESINGFVDFLIKNGVIVTSRNKTQNTATNPITKFKNQF
jgi:hypothetical protein